MTFVKEYKFKIMKQISNLNSLSKVWDIWQPKINLALGDQPTGKDIFVVVDDGIRVCGV